MVSPEPTLVYTDIISGMRDLPGVLGSWTGTKGADGEWTFGVNALADELIGRYPGFNPASPSAQIPGDALREGLASAVDAYVQAQTGFGLEERKGEGANTGYDLVKPEE